MLGRCFTGELEQPMERGAATANYDILIIRIFAVCSCNLTRSKIHERVIIIDPYKVIDTSQLLGLLSPVTMDVNVISDITCFGNNLLDQGTELIMHSSLFLYGKWKGFRRFSVFYLPLLIDISGRASVSPSIF